MKRFLTTAAAALLAATLFVGFAQDGEIPDRLVLGMVPSREADVIVDSLGPDRRMLSERLLIPVDTFVSTNYVGLVEADRHRPRRHRPVRARRAGAGDGRARRRGHPRVRSPRKHHLPLAVQRPLRQRHHRVRAAARRHDRVRRPGSASGYQFPYVTLKNDHGIDPDTEMTAIFAGSHDASALAVYNGDVDVASPSAARPAPTGRETIEADYPDVKDVMCILGYSADIPNDGAGRAPGLDPELVEQITQAMIDIANTEEGQVAHAGAVQRDRVRPHRRLGVRHRARGLARVPALTTRVDGRRRGRRARCSRRTSGRPRGRRAGRRQV
jgi:phosphonate transport system substrate-binding protein